MRFVAAFATILLAGCGAASLHRADRSMTPALIQAQVEQNHDRVLSLSGKGTIAIETADMAQSGSFELSLRKPDSLLMKIEGPFGIDVGSAMVTRDEFLFYNSFQNQLLVGTTTAANLGRILRVELAFDDVLNLFTGGIFLSEDRSTPSAFSIEDEQFVLSFERPTGTRRYWIDPETMQIVRIQFLDSRGTLALEQLFSRFRTIDGIIIPQYVRVTMMTERRRVSVSYSDIAVNPSDLQFSFQVPNTASRKHLQ